MSFSRTEPHDETPPESIDPRDEVTRERDQLRARVQEQAFEIMTLRRMLLNVLELVFDTRVGAVARLEAIDHLSAGSESREAADTAFEQAKRA